MQLQNKIGPSQFMHRIVVVIFIVAQIFLLRNVTGSFTLPARSKIMMTKIPLPSVLIKASAVVRLTFVIV
jgi:hypothetical protein